MCDIVFSYINSLLFITLQFSIPFDGIKLTQKFGLVCLCAYALMRYFAIGMNDNEQKC